MNKIGKEIIKRWKESPCQPSTKEVQVTPETYEATISDNETEISYLASYGMSNYIEYYIFLYTQPVFMFIATLANVILFAGQTFKKVFVCEVRSTTMIIMEIICYIIIFIEITSSIMHRFYRRVASKRAKKPRNIIIMIVDLVAQVVCIVFANITNLHYLYTCTFELFRLFRVYAFFHLISITPGKRTLLYTISTFGMVLFVVCHIATILAAIIGHQYENTAMETLLKESVNVLPPSEISPISTYIFCFFVVISAIGGLGLIPPSNKNDAETFLIIALMITGMVFMNGVLLGACTSIRIDIYRVNAIFYNQLQLINKNLTDGNVRKKIKTKINNFYLEFWSKEHATASSHLFTKLPNSIRNMVLLDKYWMTFNDSNLFPNTHAGFKRSLATVMDSKIRTTGEILYTQHAQKHTLMYIARGTIQLLSAEDMESSLITLGVGTFIGEMNLISTTKNHVQIIASSYCVIHCLKKVDLFRICAKYRKLNQSQIIHRQYQKIMQRAKEAQAHKSSSSAYLPFEKIKELSAKPNADVKCLYVVSEELTERTREDEIFYKTKFPWILQANSKLLFYWDIMVVILALMVSIFLPLHIAFDMKQNNLFYTSYHYIQLFYTVDLVMQLFIVTEDENGIHSKVSEILLVKLTSFRFFLDIFAAIPFRIILSCLEIEQFSTHKYLTSFTRVLKLHKVVLMFSKIENSFKFNIAALRLLKYTIYFLYLTFIFAIIYFIVACGEYRACAERSWVRKLEKETKGITIHEAFYNSLQATLLILIMTGGGNIMFSNVKEIFSLLLFGIFGMLICTFVASDYAATLTLLDHARSQYSENISVINKLSQSELMKSPENLKNLRRIYDYLSSQWTFTGGYSLKELLKDAPSHLYDTQQIAKYAPVFEKLYIFSPMGDGFHNALATKAELVYFSPNEIFVYANEACIDMYILQRGYCELIPTTKTQLSKIIGPGSDISTVEVLLGVNSLYFVRPITSVALLKVTQNQIIDIFRRYTSLEEFIFSFRQEMKISPMARKVFGHEEMRISIRDYDQQMPSFFKFPTDKTDPLYQDLLSGWKKAIIFRYIMLPCTILPEGRFIIIWEIVYNISIFILIMLNLLTDVYLWISPEIEHIVYTLETIQFIAMYIRFHVCYYDEHGILITHPKSTAKHYLTGSFLIDLIAFIPISRIYILFNYKKGDLLIYRAILNINRLLQLYRLPLIFYGFTKDELKPRGIIMNVLKFVPISVIFLNFCVALVMAISTEIVSDGDNIQVKPKPNSIVDYMVRLEYFAFNTHSLGYVYMLTLYWVTSATLQLGFAGVSATRSIDLIVTTAIILTGFLLFTYILVTMANSQTTINSQLTIHQSHMKHVVKFMKEEKVNRALQTKAIEYFEYRWQRHHGFTVDDIVNKCHYVLYQDFLYDQYKKIFMRVKVFTDLQDTLYRNLSLHLTRVYFLSDVRFIKVNDVISKMFIIHSGEVKVFNAANKFCATLTSGAIIGNIDNVHHTRSMLTYISSGSIDLLEIETKQFYNIMSGNSAVIRKLHQHILLRNLSYVPEIPSRTSLAPTKVIKKQKSIVLTRRQRKKLRILTSMALNMVFTIFSYGSICASSYLIAFYNDNHVFLQAIAMYTLDLIHILIVAIKFFTPFYDAKGQFITSTKMIKKRLVKQPWFYINVFATVPFELIGFVPMFTLGQRNVIYRTLLLNRSLRFYNIVKFFKEYNDMLNSDLLIMKLTSIFIYITLLIHAQTCTLYLFATSGYNQFDDDSWGYNQGEQTMCGNYYLCSLYVSTSILTMTGYNITIKSNRNVILIIILTIVDKIITAISVAQLSACIQNYSADLIAFDAKFVNLEVYLKRSFISKPLVRKIIGYTEQLWLKSKGVQKPVLLNTAPQYLKEEIKIEIYGKHLYNNLLFAKCHYDFLRHLLTCLSVETYFKNDTICEQGDINETMYFIHQGSIDVYFSTDTEEIKVDELEELDCFGIIQGLFPRTPHTHTFIANTVTIVLTLKLPDWFYVLRFYPASKYYIYDKLNHISSTNY